MQDEFDSIDVGCSPQLPRTLHQRIQDKTPFPLNAMLVVTERCNLKCPHCYEFKKRPLDELTADEIENILVQLKGVGTLSLVISGGEPTIRDDFFEIVASAHRHRFTITLKTSGTRLSRKEVKRCFDEGVSKMDVSLYSHLSDQHDDFVGYPGAFRKALDTLREFKTQGGKTRASIIAMNWNVDHIPYLLDLCEAEGFQYGVESRIISATDGSLAPCAFQATESQLDALYLDERLSNRIIEGTPIPRPAQFRVCGAGRNGICIRPSGDVWPCNVLPMSMGNLREQSYESIILNSQISHRLGQITWSSNPKCAACDLSWACMRCPANALRIKGDLNLPSDIDCALARVNDRARRRSKS